MIGMIDMGGGMRGVYTAGIYDYLLDQKITIDYGIGVSAGAANMITFLAGQRGRTLVFFAEYSFRKQYMSLANWLKEKNYLSLDYIYSTLTNQGGEYPLDYQAFSQTTCPFFVVATDAETGKPTYFSREDIAQDSYDILKASCAIPAACKPYPVKGRLYFDGGVSDPIPYKNALADGCEKIIVLLTRTIDYVKAKQKHMLPLSWILRKYPQIIDRLKHRHELYNQEIQEIKKLQQAGKALLIAPSSNCGVDTFTKNKEAFLNLYQKGYDDGSKIAAFLA